MSKKKSYTHLDLHQRLRIMDLLDQKVPVSRIAKELGKPISTITREIKRNSKVVASKKRLHEQEEVP